MRNAFERVVVTQRGVSPQIVHAQMVGTRKHTRVTGPQLKARLGLPDTWATFVDVSTVVAPAGPPLAAAVGVGDGVAVRTQAACAVRGAIAPATPGAPLAAQVQRSGRWHAAAATSLRRGGGYTVVLPHSGTYRVRYRGLAGPTVRVTCGAPAPTGR